MPINLKELAKICQVDISTISRALRDDKRVKISTRENIKKTALEHGYMPNLAARSLATGKTNQVALLVNTLSTSLEMQIARNLSTLLLAKDIDLVLFQHFNEPKIYTRQLQRLLKNQFDAAIIIPGGSDNASSIINKFTPAEIPTILIDRYPAKPKVPVVTTNNMDAAQSLCEAIFQNKIDTIIPLFGTQNIIEKQRTKGLKKSALKHNVKVISQGDDFTKLKGKNVAIISSSAPTLQNFYNKNVQKLEQANLFVGSFDYWAIDTTPFQSVQICIQDFNRISEIAIDFIFNSDAQKTGIQQVKFKEIVTVKKYHRANPH